MLKKVSVRLDEADADVIDEIATAENVNKAEVLRAAFAITKAVAGKDGIHTAVRQGVGDALEPTEVNLEAVSNIIAPEPEVVVEVPAGLEADLLDATAKDIYDIRYALSGAVNELKSSYGFSSSTKNLLELNDRLAFIEADLIKVRRAIESQE
mgnify:FL=1